MCVLASAVDIDLLTHREAVISNSWSPPRFVLCLPITEEYFWMLGDFLASLSF